MFEKSLVKMPLICIF
jgi:hypothetical protein